jgi:hypothetical protein
VIQSIRIAQAGLIDLPEKKYSTETVARALCEMNVVLDLALIETLNASEHIGVGYELCAYCFAHH